MTTQTEKYEESYLTRAKLISPGLPRRFFQAVALVQIRTEALVLRDAFRALGGDMLLDVGRIVRERGELFPRIRRPLRQELQVGRQRERRRAVAGQGLAETLKRLAADARIPIASLPAPEGDGERIDEIDIVRDVSEPEIGFERRRQKRVVDRED